MAYYYTDWEDDNIGFSPSGWTRRWNAIDAPIYHALAVRYGTPLVKRRELRYYAIAGNGFAGSTIAAWTWDAIDADANRHNVDILTLCKRDDTGSPTIGTRQFRLWARGSGATSATANGYHMRMSFYDEASPLSNTLKVYRFLSGSLTIVAAVNFVFDVTKAYWFRFRVQNAAGSPTAVRVQVKTWAEAEEEPAEWTIDVNDYSPEGFAMTGWVGIGAGSVSTVDNSGAYNFFSVATNGDTAFKPKTNTEFSAWLDSKAQRRVLFEATATGYDSTGGAVAPVPYTYLLTPSAAAVAGSPTVLGVASTADSALNSVAGDFEIRVDFLAEDYSSSGGGQVLMSKYNTATGNQRAFLFDILDGGTLRLLVSADGTTIPISASATEVRNAPGVRHFYRVTYDANNGAGGSTTTFYESLDGGFSWVQIGAAVVGAVTAVFNSTARLMIGAFNDTAELLENSRIYRAQLYNGIDGQLVADFDPTKATNGATSFVAATGETWTITPPSTIVAPYTYTRDRKVYIANGGFSSKSYDSPANKIYPPWIKRIPTFSSELGLALSGALTSGVGQLDVVNPRRTAGSGGERDDWLRMKWKRDYGKLYLGDPSWAKHDFRLIVLARVSQPTATAEETITFQLSDISEVLDGLVQTNKFSSGPNANKYKPIAAGTVAWVDPPEVDGIRTYQLHDGQLYVGSSDKWILHTLTDEGNKLFTSYTRGQCVVDTALDIITTQTAHGALEGYRAVFSGGLLSTAPGGITFYTEYYVKSVGSPTFGSNVLAFSTTLGGPAIDLTSAGSKWTLYLYGYWINYASGEATLVTDAVGRVSSSLVAQGPAATNWNAAVVLDYLMFSKGKVSPNFKDSASFTTLQTDLASQYAGVYVGLDGALIREVATKLMQGIGGYIGVTPDGLIKVGRVGLPTTARMAFAERDVAEGTLKEVNQVRPVDFTKSDVTYAPPNLANGPLLYNNHLVLFLDLDASAGLDQSTRYYVDKTRVASYDYGAYGAPLDSHPDLAEAEKPKTFETVIYDSASAAIEQTRLATLFMRSAAVYEFTTRLRACELDIGDTISLEHSRQCWKRYTASDPSSPDDLTTRDSRLAIVLKKEVDLSVSTPWAVKLTVVRPVYGYYPTADLN